MLRIVEEIIFNFSNNKSLYIGEELTMSEHMIQTAMLAEKNKCSNDLVFVQVYFMIMDILFLRTQIN